MSKIGTVLQLAKEPKRLKMVVQEKCSFFRQEKMQKIRNFLCGFSTLKQTVFNMLLRKKDRLRIKGAKGTVILVSPYIGVPQMMAVTNYINCWLEGFRANKYDALFVASCQSEKPDSIPGNLKGSLLRAPFKEATFLFSTILENECPGFVLFHNSPPSVECAYSSNLKKSQRYLFVGDCMSRRLEDPIERRAYIDKVINGFGGIIAVSDYILREWSSYGFDPEHIFVARTPVNATLWPAYHGSSSHAEAGYFGNIYHKEIDNLLEISQLVSQEIQNFKLTIFGDGYPEDRVKLQKKIFENGLAKVIDIHESVPIERMRIIQSNMDVLLLPRERGEFSDAGFPNKIGEYLASGCPVVCTDVGEISQVLKPGEQIRIVEPGDNISFAEEVIECLRSRERSLEIAQAGRNFIESYASPEIVAKAFMEWRAKQVQYAKI